MTAPVTVGNQRSLLIAERRLDMRPAFSVIAPLDRPSLWHFRSLVIGSSNRAQRWQQEDLAYNFRNHCRCDRPAEAFVQSLAECEHVRLVSSRIEPVRIGKCRCVEHGAMGDGQHRTALPDHGLVGRARGERRITVATAEEIGKSGPEA